MVEITLRKVRYTYPGATEPTLKGINLELSEGKITSLLGPSGEGKTTVLKIIAGFMRPEEGDVLFDGESVLDIPPEERGLGIVFQNYALFPHMNVFQNVAFGLRMRGKRGTEVEKRVKDVLDLVGLKGMEKRYPKELSGGQQQRLALARALAPEPQVLLLDEPLSALDAALRGELRSEIRRIQREVGLTTLYITHDQSEALFLSDRVALLMNGKVVQVGAPEEVYLKPENLEVARFLEVNNLFEGEVSEIRESGVRVLLNCDDGVEIVGGGNGFKVGEKVVVGIRPFHIDLNPSPKTAKNILSVELVDVKFTGRDYILTLRNQELVFTARATPMEYERIKDPLLRGGRIKIHLPEDKILLYKKAD